MALHSTTYPMPSCISPPVTTNKLKSTGKYIRIHWPQWLCSPKCRSDCLIAGIAGQILLRACIFVSCTCCVVQMSWPLVQKSYEVCVFVCDLETSTMRKPRSKLGCCTTKTEREREKRILLTFRGRCIVIYSYNKTNEMHYFTNLFWCRTLHVSDSKPVWNM